MQSLLLKALTSSIWRKGRLILLDINKTAPIEVGPHVVIVLVGRHHLITGCDPMTRRISSIC